MAEKKKKKKKKVEEKSDRTKMQRITVKEIGIEDLVFRKDNPNAMTDSHMELLKENILCQEGLTPPIVVTPHPEKQDKFIVLDGEQRTKAALAEGYEFMTCDVWGGVSLEETLVLINTLNDLRGTNDPLKKEQLMKKAQGILPDDSYFGRVPGAMSRKVKTSEPVSDTTTATKSDKSTAVRSASDGNTPDDYMYAFTIPSEYAKEIGEALEIGDKIADLKGIKKMPGTARGFLGMALFVKQKGGVYSNANKKPEGKKKADKKPAGKKKVKSKTKVKPKAKKNGKVKKKVKKVG